MACFKHAHIFSPAWVNLAASQAIYCPHARRFSLRESTAIPIRNAKLHDVDNIQIWLPWTQTRPCPDFARPRPTVAKLSTQAPCNIFYTLSPRRGKVYFCLPHRKIEQFWIWSPCKRVGRCSSTDFQPLECRSPVNPSKKGANRTHLRFSLCMFACKCQYDGVLASDLNQVAVPDRLH